MLGCLIRHCNRFFAASRLMMVENQSKKLLHGQSYCVTFDNVKAAESVIKPYVYYTPLMTCSAIDKLCGRKLFFKCENFQKTGSFKIRGATNAVFNVTQGSKVSRPKCVVTHSSGNHGQALAKAAEMFEIPAYIIMPTTSAQCKKDAVRGYGAEVIECPPTDKGRIETADRVCGEKNGTIIHPNQCPDVISGQGTMAIEMLEQNPDLDIIVAPVGGGSMISGIAIAAKHLKPSIRVYAAEPENANDCYLSKINGRITPLPEPPITIADGVKVMIGANAWPIIRDLVDDVITVTEEEIKQATKLIWERAKLVIEPTSGVGVAAVLGNKFSTACKNKDSLKNVGVVLCGGNADLAVVAKMFEE